MDKRTERLLRQVIARAEVRRVATEQRNQPIEQRGELAVLETARAGIEQRRKDGDR